MCKTGGCVSLQQLAKTAERAEAALTLEKLFDELLAEPRGGKGLASFAKGVREPMCVKGVPVFDGDVRTVFMKSGLISGIFFTS